MRRRPLTLLVLLVTPVLPFAVAHEEQSLNPHAPDERKPAVKVGVWVAAIGRQMNGDDGLWDDELEIEIDWSVDHWFHGQATGTTPEVNYDWSAYGGLDHRMEVNILLYEHIECSDTEPVHVSYSVREIDTVSDDNMGSSRAVLPPGTGEHWSGTGQLNVWFRRSEAAVPEPTQCDPVCLPPEKSNGSECVCVEGTQREGSSCNIVCPTNTRRTGEHPGACVPLVCEGGRVPQNNECVCPARTQENEFGYCAPEGDPPVVCPREPCPLMAPPLRPEEASPAEMLLPTWLPSERHAEAAAVLP